VVTDVSVEIQKLNPTPLLATAMEYLEPPYFDACATGHYEALALIFNL
jgi:hypothetical protein